MAENKMLIDATHPEETRVVVLREGRVEEFDYESAARKLLRGSIFLAKITRVEPSLQAAFVDYGGNRHGFLAFNEIHPDYYQIPHADRQALIDEEIAAQSFERDDDLSAVEEPRDKRRRRRSRASGSATEDGNKDVTAELDPAADSDAVAAADETTVIELVDPEMIDQLEDAAIDVSELLPPEAPVEEAPIADVADAADSAGEDSEPPSAVTATTSDFEAADPAAEVITNVAASDDEAATETDDRVEVAAEDDSTDERPSDDQPSDADRTTPPKSIAAATPPDERVVSDAFEQPAEIEAANEAEEVTVGEDVGGGEAAAGAVIQDETSDDAVAVDDVGAADLAPADDAEPTPPENDAVDAGGDEGDDVATLGPDPEDDGDQPEPVARSTDDDGDDDDTSDENEPDEIDDVGDTDALEEVPVRRRRRARSYKIQEVIKRRQIVLVQVVKEERGNKGAALTTYLSLAGRYTVLMPNTARGGGISRKITNIQDRKRLKAIAQELDVPEGMGLIIRTAGAARTKQEIKRDFEYLLRLWESVRDLTLQSTAPSLVYEEGDLIKRSIRDLYSKDVEQVLVAGEEAHKEAKSFMRMLMPSHAKNVVKYEDAQPLFARYRIEQQLNAMFSPFVQLKSGGYLVINQTEALVAVDVNSGKSTRKFSIEDTALNTNLEAAEELSRQLKLRDLAGLIVIDFIDMEEKRNNRAVERRLKECLRDDRARIQVGRISHFGLLEMSRQRLRTGVLEGSTMPCSHCQGTGIIRSTESVALAVLRALEDNLMSGSPRSLVAHCSRDAAMYLLNQKREFVQEIETRYGISIYIQSSDSQQGADFTVERVNGGSPLPRRVDRPAVNVDSGFDDDAQNAEARDSDREDSEERRPRRRRRRRGRRGEGETGGDVEAREPASTADDDVVAANDGDVEASTDSEDREGEERSSRRRRRGRRGGRRNRPERGGNENVAEPGAPQPEISLAEQPDWHHGEHDEDGDAADGVAHSGEEGTEPEVETTSVVAVAAAETSAIVDPHDETADNDDHNPSAAAHDDAAAAEFVGDVEPAAMPEVDAPVKDMESPASAAIADPASEDIEASDKDETPRNGNGRSGVPQSSEPVLERIVLSPPDSDGESAVEEEATAKPVRKGWWQRRFGA